jgi:hypothetical protein
MLTFVWIDLYIELVNKDSSTEMLNLIVLKFRSFFRPLVFCFICLNIILNVFSVCFISLFCFRLVRMVTNSAY